MKIDEGCPCSETYGPHSKDSVDYVIGMMLYDEYNIRWFRPCKSHASMYERPTWVKRYNVTSGDVKYYYIRGKGGQKVACIASRKIGKRIYAGLSVWNQKLDKFDKDEAKKYALQRLEGKFGEKFTYIVNETGAKTSILMEIALDKEVPVRVRDAAYDWLGVEEENRNF